MKGKDIGKLLDRYATPLERYQMRLADYNHRQDTGLKVSPLGENIFR